VAEAVVRTTARRSRVGVPGRGREDRGNRAEESDSFHPVFPPGSAAMPALAMASIASAPAATLESRRASGDRAPVEIGNFLGGPKK